MGRWTIRHGLAGMAVAALSFLSVSATSVPPGLTAAQSIAALNIGTNEVGEGRYSDAVNRLTLAIDSSALQGEPLALAYQRRGIAHQALGQTGSAIFDYTHAIDLDALPPTTLARTYYNRGLAASTSGDRAGAERDYTKAIDILPDYAAAYHNRANLERERHDYPTAIRDYTLAAAHLQGEKRKLPLYGRALAHEKTGDIDAAVADLDAALAADPDYTPAKAKLAALAPGAGPVVAQASADDDIVTGSIAPGGGKMDIPSDGGWTTTAERVSGVAPAVPAPRAPDTPLQTASLRPIDMVPAPPVATESPKEAQAPAESPSPSGHYKVQLGAFRAPDVADKAWAAISRRHADLVASLEHNVEEADLGAKGVYYRLQAGAFGTASEAKSRCASFSASNIDCIVVER